MVNGEFQDAWVNTNRDRAKWIRVDVETGGLYRFNPDTAQYDIPLPISMSAITGLIDALADKAGISHEHTEHGDINFTGIVSAAGEPGLTGQRTVGGFQITFKAGLLVGFEPV